MVIITNILTDGEDTVIKVSDGSSIRINLDETERLFLLNNNFIGSELLEATNTDKIFTLSVLKLHYYTPNEVLTFEAEL